jgi:hypothetical protein
MKCYFLNKPRLKLIYLDNVLVFDNNQFIIIKFYERETPCSR